MIISTSLHMNPWDMHPHGARTTMRVVGTAFEQEWCKGRGRECSLSVAIRDIMLRDLPSPIASAMMPPLKRSGASDCSSSVIVLIYLSSRVSMYQAIQLAPTTYLSPLREQYSTRHKSSCCPPKHHPCSLLSMNVRPCF